MSAIKKLMACLLAACMLLSLPFAVSASESKPLTLVGAFINPKADNQVVLTFSEPITYTGSLDLRVYPVDANLDSTINNTYPAWSYWWIDVTGYYGTSGRQLIGTLKVPNSNDNQAYRAVLSNFGSYGPIKLAVWESADGTTASNGYVDNVTSADGSRKLVANKTAARDVALTDITQETVSVESIQIISDTTLEIAYSEGVTLDVYYGEHNLFKAIRLTNDLFELQKDNSGNWMQYGGTWNATDDPAVWQFTVSGKTFSQIADMIGPGGTYEGLKMTFAIEQVYKKNGQSLGDLTNLLDNQTSLDGVRPVNATNDNTTAWLDGSYTEITMVPTPIYAFSINSTQVRIALPFAATAGTGNVLIGDVPSTALTRESDTTYIATFPEGTIFPDPNMSMPTSVTIPAGLFTSKLGQTNTEVSLECNNISFSDNDDETVTLDTTTTYSFMNADTGREIAVDGVTEFTPIVSPDKNAYIFRAADGRFLDMTGTAPVLIEQAVLYQLHPCDNDRYMIYVNDDYAVYDTDGGSTNVPTLSLTATDSIAAGWYLTKSGDTKPLRFMPLGDSITYGTNPDGYLHAWRDTLSAALGEYMDVPVVFVGAQVSKVVSVNSTELYRHEGHPGWFVTDIYDGDGQEEGLDSIIDGVITKYQPDITLLQIGTNDAAYCGKNNFINNVEGKKEQLLANYIAFVESFAPRLSENGAVFCSAIVPGNPAKRGDYEVFDAFAAEVPGMVKQMQNDGYSVYLNDNNTDFPSDGWCSDGLHMSESGDQHIASRYLTAVRTYYNADGSKKEANIQFNLCEGAIAIWPAGQNRTPGGSYNFHIVVDDGYEGTPIVTIDAVQQPISDTNDYTIKNLPTQVSITVTGLTKIVPITEGWQLNEVGWWYQNADGTYPAAAWAYIDNAWYYFNEAGYMTTGWQYIGGVWYYMNAGGAMVTGWLNDGGTWYYMSGSGAMVTGWVNDGGTWYYMSGSGAMHTGWLNDGGVWYYMNASGAMQTGWVNDGGTWYYMNAGGAMQTGWILDGSTWYYLDASGAWIA